MDAIAHAVQDFLRDYGYVALFVLIVLESTAVPVPSLLVMPFAGYWASKGNFSLPAILVINSVGAAVGSGLSYWFGYRGGKALLLRYGKWFFIKPADIERTEAFFEKYGARTILIARFLPVIRHIISIPAGVARMRLSTFFTLTIIGASLWGGGLMILGYVLGDNWEGVVKTWKKFDLVIAGLIVVTVLAAAIRFLRSRKARAQAAAEVNGAHTDAPDERAGPSA